MTGSSLVKVVALYGSLRKASFNNRLLNSAVMLKKADGNKLGIEITTFDISNLPLVNSDEIKTGTFNSEVSDFRRTIANAHSILFVLPEDSHHFLSVPAPLKNAIDWAFLSENVWARRSAAILSAGGSLREGMSQSHLRQIGVSLNLHFMNEAFFINSNTDLGEFNTELTDENAKKELKKVLESLKTFTLKNQKNRNIPGSVL